jgi:predicted metal-dependent hydrolase
MPEYLQIAGQTIPVKYRLSARARRIGLHVEIERGIEIVLPRGVSQREGERLLRDNLDWVEKTWQRLSTRARRQGIKPGSGEAPLEPDEILIGGKRVKIVIQKGRGQPSLNLLGTTLLVPTVNGTKAEAQKKVLLWLKKQSAGLLEAAVRKYAPLMAVRPVKISLRDQRTRWGSCSHRGTLSFNWRLVMAPAEILNYVVIHELAHLRHHNHSAAFWAFVAQYDPNVKKYRFWLKTNGALLRPAWLVIRSSRQE